MSNNQIVLSTPVATAEEIRFLQLVGIGGLAPRKKGVIKERVMSPLNGEVAFVPMQTHISLVELRLEQECNMRKYWSATPSSARKRWRKGHGKRAKQLAKKQGLTR